MNYIMTVMICKTVPHMAMEVCIPDNGSNEPLENTWAVPYSL